MKPLAPNTLLQDRYLVTKIIGKGGMGEVYLATDQRLGHTVALKRTTVGDDAMLADAFENEAKTLAGLRHPVLPKVSDHFLENEEQFLVMDFIEGDDLSERLKESSKPFPLNWVMFWADQLLEALNYLHTHDPPIIHRDIKPQNLKLTGENQIVLLDFGLSKNSVGQTRVTTSGSVVGYTPHYAPMEQIRGTGTNAKSDIYALSATIYQLLTNTVPPDALTRADSLLANLPDPLRPLSEINGELSGEISDTVMKGMEISQDRRFENAREMQKRLRHAFNSMRESMSAETVAFNVSGDADAAPASDQPASPDSIEPPVPVALSETPGKDATEDLSGEKTEVFNAGDLDTAPEPAKTAAIIPDVIPGEPEGDKTEVLLDHVLSETPASVPPEAPTGFETEDDFSGVEVPDEIGTDFETKTGSDKTVPLVNLESEDTGESFDEGENESEPTPPPAEAASAASAHQPPPSGKKKGGGSSTGKYLAILAGMALILVLVSASVAGGLWYWSQMGDSAGTGVDPTPSVEESVEPSVEATPSVEETPDEGNMNVDQNGAETEETPGDDDPTPETRTTPARSTTTTGKTPVTRRTPVRKATPRVRPTKPVVKKTPKKKKDPGVL